MKALPATSSFGGAFLFREPWPQIILGTARNDAYLDAMT